MDILPTVFDNISHFGPLARTMDDAALFMNVTSGPDERDIMSLPDTLEFPLPAESDINGMKLALSVDLGYYAIDSDVESRVREAARALQSCGATVEEVDIAWTREINDAWFEYWGVYLEVCFVKDFEKWRDQLDPNVVELIERGRKMDATTLKRMEVLRTNQWHKLRTVLKDYDALLCPTMSTPAPPNGSTDMDFLGDADDNRFHGLDLTSPFNFVGQCPALSVPCGFSGAGLPVGLQIVGRRYDDLSVMRIGAALERARPWSGRRPKL